MNLAKSAERGKRSIPRRILFETNFALQSPTFTNLGGIDSGLFHNQRRREARPGKFSNRRRGSRCRERLRCALNIENFKRRVSTFFAVGNLQRAEHSSPEFSPDKGTIPHFFQFYLFFLEKSCFSRKKSGWSQIFPGKASRLSTSVWTDFSTQYTIFTAKNSFITRRRSRQKYLLARSFCPVPILRNLVVPFPAPTSERRRPVAFYNCVASQASPT